MTIGRYAAKRNEFQLALVDEAHNLQSAIELDSSIVRVVHIPSNSEEFDIVVSLLPRGNHNSTQELNPTLAHDILEALQNFSPRQISFKRILNNLSSWRIFGVTSDSGYDLKFLAADPERRSLMPKGKLLLFSATPLDKEELDFYCSIKIESVEIFGDSAVGFLPKPNVAYCYVEAESDDEKKAFATSILRQSGRPTLILMNNNSTCLDWGSYLEREFPDRIFTIRSHLSYSARLKGYLQFQQLANPILVTSSSVYWEGINIKDLRILIVPNPPFPHPNLLEIASNKHAQNKKITSRRLIQGAGRVGRGGQGRALCLFLFKPGGLEKYCKPVSADDIRTLIDNGIIVLPD